MTPASEFRAFDPVLPVAVIGMGVMGAKVAWATARAGIPVHACDVDPAVLTRAMERAREWSSPAELPVVERNLRATPRLEDALAGVQLAFENVPEDLELKRRVLTDIERRLDAAAYLGTNTSSLLCSEIAAPLTRPERFFALNWSDPRFMRLTELMGGPATSPATIGFAQAWARHLGMIPLLVRKEQMGYSFNRLWRVIKKEVLRQIAEGYTTPHDIDRAWMLAFGTDFGPCGLMDQVGMNSIRKIELAYFKASGDPTDPPPAFLDDMIAKNQLGESTGAGFYTYPDPEYRRRGFLEGKVS
jgi:3-hydroxybutyryl-CoA dehydrogenase